MILKDREILLRKKAELSGGVADGASGFDEYSEPYRLFKLDYNPIAQGQVDLILTGATRDALILVSLGDGEFTFESQDPKWGELIRKYGQRIGGVNKEVFTGLQKSKYSSEVNRKLKEIAGL